MKACPLCQNKLTRTTIDYDYSKQSGISDLVLTDVDEYRCLKCDKEFVDLGDDRTLAETIADSLLELEELTNEHACFIRTHFFEETVFQFAKRIKENPRSIHAFEKNKLSKEKHAKLSLKTQEALIAFYASNITVKIGNSNLKF
ncbi:MAG: hypothetical protein AAGB31_15475 [Bdellovibrio sp.]